jgi:hypothetical protein
MEEKMMESNTELTYQQDPTFEKLWLSIKELRESQKKTDLQQKKTDLQIEETDLQIKQTDRQIKEANREFRAKQDKANREFRTNLEKTNREFWAKQDKANREFWANQDKINREFRANLDKTNLEFRANLDKTSLEFRANLDKTSLELKTNLEQTNLERMKSDIRLEGKISKYGNRLGEIVEAMLSPGLKEKFKAFGFAFNVSYRDKEVHKDGRFITELDVCLESDREVMVIEIKTKPDIDDIKEHIERMDTLKAFADSVNDKRKYFGAIGGMVFGDNIRNYVLKRGFYSIEPSGEDFDVFAPEGKYKPRIW